MYGLLYCCSAVSYHSTSHIYSSSAHCPIPRISHSICFSGGGGACEELQIPSVESCAWEGRARIGVSLLLVGWLGNIVDIILYYIILYVSTGFASLIKLSRWYKPNMSLPEPNKFAEQSTESIAAFVGVFFSRGGPSYEVSYQVCMCPTLLTRLCVSNPWSCFKIYGVFNSNSVGLVRCMDLHVALSGMGARCWAVRLYLVM